MVRINCGDSIFSKDARFSNQCVVAFHKSNCAETVTMVERALSNPHFRLGHFYYKTM